MHRKLLLWRCWRRTGCARCAQQRCRCQALSVAAAVAHRRPPARLPAAPRRQSMATRGQESSMASRPAAPTPTSRWGWQERPAGAGTSPGGGGKAAGRRPVTSFCTALPLSLQPQTSVPPCCFRRAVRGCAAAGRPAPVPQDRGRLRGLVRARHGPGCWGGAALCGRSRPPGGRKVSGECQQGNVVEGAGVLTSKQCRAASDDAVGAGGGCTTAGPTTHTNTQGVAAHQPPHPIPFHTMYRLHTMCP